MKNPVLLHCANPRLAGLEPDCPARAADRLEAFAALLAAARGLASPAVLVAGDLLLSGPGDPDGFSGLCGLLDAARADGIKVIATCEGEAVGALARLARAERIELLGFRGEERLASVDPVRGLRIAGLGRPPSTAEARRRLALAGRAPKGGEVVALIDDREAAELDGSGAEGSFAYLAGTVAPGPLTRPGVEDLPREPAWLEVRLEKSGAAARRVASGDRPLVVFRLDAASAAGPHGLETALLAAVEPVPRDPAPLVRIEIHGAPRFDPRAIDDERLREVARDRLGAPLAEVVLDLELETREGDRFRPTTSREALEAQVLERLLAPRPARERAAFLRILERLERGEDAAAAAEIGLWMEGS